MRTVKIAFPGSSRPESIQSDATTWGDLKSDIYDELSKEFENQTVRDRQTRHRYDDDAAVLPTGDIQLLVSADKNKSGNVTKANYHKAGFTDLRTFCKKMTGFAPNGKQACVDALDAYYGKSSSKAEEKPTSKAKPSRKMSQAKEVKETIPAAPKKSGDLEARVAKLEKAVFTKSGKAKSDSPKDDSYWD